MSLLNQLRGAYAASPPGVRDAVAPLLALVPPRYRYGSAFFETQRELIRAHNDADFVARERLARLRRVVAAACKAPYYEALFKQVYGGMPDVDAFDFSDLARLPVLTKNELRDDAQAFLSKPLSEVDVASTSGSSGRPLKFYLDKDRGSKEFATITHFWSRIGFEVGRSRRAVLRGVHLNNVDAKPWQWDAALGELRLSPFHLTPDNMACYADLIERYRIDFIHGYPSAMMMFAGWVLSSGWKPPVDLKGLLPASEPMQEAQRELILGAFPHCQMLKYYGMSEKVLIGAQAGEDPDSYELEPLYGYGEVVRADGTACAVGEQGALVGTGFVSMAMPLLRYNTEDAATLVQVPSHDNYYRLRVHNIQGRWYGEYVLGRGGELVSIAAINLHSQVYASIEAFQLYQDTPGDVVVKVVPKAGTCAGDIQPLVDEIQAKNGNSINFRLELVEALPPATANGKRPFIDQRLDLSTIVTPHSVSDCGVREVNQNPETSAR